MQDYGSSGDWRDWEDELTDVYQKQVRSVLELAVPVWQPGITMQEKYQLERVQKCALYIILGEHYTSYSKALIELNLETLEVRRKKICENFVKKAAKNPKFKHWFKLKLEAPGKTRKSKKHLENRFYHPQSRTSRFRNSPLPYLTELLNNTKWRCSLCISFKRWFVNCGL